MTRPSGTMSDFSGTVEFDLESVNWETVCKLVIDENAKLRESNDMLAKMLGDRAADCYKLRELVRDLYYCCSSNDRCHPCPYFSADTECPEPHFSERMRELGIEVD